MPSFHSELIACEQALKVAADLGIMNLELETYRFHDGGINNDGISLSL